MLRVTGFPRKCVLVGLGLGAGIVELDAVTRGLGAEMVELDAETRGLSAEVVELDAEVCGALIPHISRSLECVLGISMSVTEM